MSTLLSLPDEILCAIVRYLRSPSSSRDSSEVSLPGIAGTCRKLNRLAIPFLYESIAISTGRDVLRQLLCSLMTSTLVSQSVKSMDINHNFVGKDGAEWEFPEDFHDICQKWLAKSGLTPAFTKSWEQRLRDDDEDAEQTMFAVIFACPNLVKLHVPAERPSSYWRETPCCQLFSSTDWPWHDLKEIHITSGSNDGRGDSDAELLSQLYRALSSSGRHLSSLVYSTLTPYDVDWLSREMKPQMSLESLTLQDTHGIDNNEWSAPRDLVAACVGLKHFDLDINSLEIDSAIEGFPSLFTTLLIHKDCLQTIKFSFEDDEDTIYELEDMEANELPPLSPETVVKLSELSVLEEISMAMPCLFGFAFYTYIWTDPPIFGTLSYDKFHTRSRDLTERIRHDYRDHNKLKTPSQDFGMEFRDVLVSNLPPSLRTLDLEARDPYQTQALAHALHGLVENRNDRFGALSTIKVRTNRPSDFSGLFGLVDSCNNLELNVTTFENFEQDLLDM